MLEGAATPAALHTAPRLPCSARFMRPLRHLLFALPVVLASSLALGDAMAAHVQPIDVHRWQVVQRESGPTNYYWIVDAQPAFVRARYEPPMETTLLGVQFNDADKRAAQ